MLRFLWWSELQSVHILLTIYIFTYLAQRKKLKPVFLKLLLFRMTTFLLLSLHLSVTTLQMTHMTISCTSLFLFTGPKSLPLNSSQIPALALAFLPFPLQYLVLSASIPSSPSCPPSLPPQFTETNKDRIN